MHLISTSQSIFQQLRSLLSQLSPDEYCASLSLLSENSIGKHIRHILEFFDLLVQAAMNGERINYDKREHDRNIESDLALAEAKIRELSFMIEKLNGDKPMQLEASYIRSDETVTVNTSVNRELAYNIEHAIHHMAIIRIAVNALFPKVELSENFGVAYSTARYQEK